MTDDLMSKNEALNIAIEVMERLIETAKVSKDKAKASLKGKNGEVWSALATQEILAMEAALHYMKVHGRTWAVVDDAR